MAFKKIVVALDGSEASEKILPPVTGLAKSLGAELILLAVTEKDGTIAGSEDKKPASDYLESLVGPLAEMGVTATTVTETGDPVGTIAAIANTQGADLVAMATHHGNAIARLFTGSVTDDVLKRANLPVLAINPDSGPAIHAGVTSVIVPLDGSDLAEESVPVAMEIAKGCGAELVFVQSVHMPTMGVSGPGIENVGGDFIAVKEREGAIEYLSGFADKAKTEGIDARTHAAIGKAAARIIEDSKDIPGSIIVITSHGRGGFKRMMLGSVADELVRDSHHPVLVLKHRE